MFRQSDDRYADTLYDAAVNLYSQVSDPDNHGSYSNVDQPDCRNPGDPLQVPPHCLCLSQIRANDGVDILLCSICVVKRSSCSIVTDGIGATSAAAVRP